MVTAITRDISPSFCDCELTHLERTPIDLNLANAQHRDYVEALRQLGCDVIELPPDGRLPDSVFVEDTAIVLPEVAVITRPGADSRKPETEPILRALSPYRKLFTVREPATVDGGDVLILGKQIFVGLSTRSNTEAVDQLNEFLNPFGYQVTGVKTYGCLHLKSAVTCVDNKTLLINRDWVDHQHFKSFDLIDVDPSEPFAANCLPIGEAILYPTAFPRTRARLEERGYRVVAIDMSELAKAEGAVTCCSLIISRPSRFGKSHSS